MARGWSRELARTAAVGVALIVAAGCVEDARSDGGAGGVGGRADAGGLDAGGGASGSGGTAGDGGSGGGASGSGGTAGGAGSSGGASGSGGTAGGAGSGGGTSGSGGTAGGAGSGGGGGGGSGGSGGGGSVSYAFDLDGDATADTNLLRAPCTGQPMSQCLFVQSALTGVTPSIPLTAWPESCGAGVEGRRVVPIGNHTGGAYQEVAVVFCAQPFGATEGRPALAVVDVQAGTSRTVLSPLGSPPGGGTASLTSAFVAYPHGADGKLYPVFAPGVNDADVDRNYSPFEWGYGCVYRPTSMSDPRCGPGFVGVTLQPAASYFREHSGYLQDLDGDGWEDVTLIYHQRVVALSPRTATVLNVLTFDVAAAAEPSSPTWFHSGRNYGTHAAVTGADGTLRTIMVAGAAPYLSRSLDDGGVGGPPRFQDYNCNVTRFVGALASTPGQPGTRHLAWVQWMGFASTAFDGVYTAAGAADVGAHVLRAGDGFDKCVHGISTGLTSVNGVPAVVYNYFRNTTPETPCLAENYAIWIPPLPPPGDFSRFYRFYDCLKTKLTTPGVWGTAYLRQDTGASITGGQHVYTWGYSRRVLPSGEPVYAVELLGSGASAFDLSDRAPTPVSMMTLSAAGLYVSQGQLPAAGRPRVVPVLVEGSVGNASSSVTWELDLADVDRDGLLDFRLELADGGLAWVGHRADAGFVFKP